MKQTDLVFRPYGKRRSRKADELPSATDVFSAARRRVLLMYGPCAATSPTVIIAMARRDVEGSGLPHAPRTKLLAELDQLASPVGVA